MLLCGMFACDKNVVTGSFMNFKTEGKKQKCRDVKDTELYCSYNVPALDDVACAEGEGDISGIEHLAAIKLARVVNLDVVAGLHTSAGWERKERKGHAGMRECIPYCIERVQKILRANAVLRQGSDTQHRRHYKTYRGSLARTLLHGGDLEAASKGFGLTQEDRSALAGIAGHQHKGRHKAQGRRTCQNLERQSACVAAAPPNIGHTPARPELTRSKERFGLHFLDLEIFRRVAHGGRKRWGEEEKWRGNTRHGQLNGTVACSNCNRRWIFCRCASWVILGLNMGITGKIYILHI